jgi:hypothetical protein
VLCLPLFSSLYPLFGSSLRECNPFPLYPEGITRDISGDSFFNPRKTLIFVTGGLDAVCRIQLGSEAICNLAMKGKSGLFNNKTKQDETSNFFYTFSPFIALYRGMQAKRGGGYF